MCDVKMTCLKSLVKLVMLCMNFSLIVFSVELVLFLTLGQLRVTSDPKSSAGPPPPVWPESIVLSGSPASFWDSIRSSDNLFD